MVHSFNFFQFFNPPFYILRHYETVQSSHFLSDIRFSQKISKKYISILSEFSRWRFQYVAVYPNFCRYIRTIMRFTKEKAGIRKQAIPFVPARYIRTLDVISEVICVLMRWSRMINKRLHLSQHATSELLRGVFRALKTPFECFETFL